MGNSMTSREVICCSCKHQFREFFRADNPLHIRSEDGSVLEANLSQYPQCGKILYITHDSLIGLDRDKYEPMEYRLE